MFNWIVVTLSLIPREKNIRRKEGKFRPQRSTEETKNTEIKEQAMIS